MLYEQIASTLQTQGFYSWAKDGRELTLHVQEHRGIPYLLARPSGEDLRPAVFVQHGLTGSKETALPVLLGLAEAGYVVVAPDARLHGTRRAPDFDERFRDHFLPNFFEAVRGTGEDIVELLDYLQSAGVAKAGPVGITGFSMGGYISFMVPLMDPRFIVSAPTAGSPIWRMPGHEERYAAVPKPLLDAIARLEPYANLQRLNHVAWLIQNGQADQVVPFKPAEVFYRAILPYYADKPEQLRLKLYPEAEHVLVPEMVEEVLSWFARFLPI